MHVIGLSFFLFVVMQEIALDNPSHSFRLNFRMHIHENFLKEKNKKIKELNI